MSQHCRCCTASRPIICIWKCWKGVSKQAGRSTAAGGDGNDAAASVGVNKGLHAMLYDLQEWWDQSQYMGLQSRTICCLSYRLRLHRVARHVTMSTPASDEDSRFLSDGDVDITGT
ncbi:uncharacterized protein [Physcomitrium patens]|uniref:uncharacterized protein isoform X2 n=1 Tax=Physcomitrium patens TaxID=3218 RepID=UPI00024AC3FD